MAETDHNGFPDIRLWRNAASPALLADPIVQCLILIVITSAFFLLFPGVDVWFSSLFYEPGRGFPVSELAAFRAFRDLHRGTTWVVPIALVVVLLLKIAMPWRPSLVPPRHTLFILSSLAIASGIVTNLIFKNNWGRPRPTTVLPFAGDHPFIGVWQFSNYCATNCSFVSGEASSSIWLLTLAVLVPVAWRIPALKVIAVFALLFSLNRIAFGGHFLSDVMLAWWISLAIIIALYRLIYVNTPPWLENARLEAGLGRIGIALRRPFRTAKADEKLPAP